MVETLQLFWEAQSGVWPACLRIFPPCYGVTLQELNMYYTWGFVLPPSFHNYRFNVAFTWEYNFLHLSSCFLVSM